MMSDDDLCPRPECWKPMRLHKDGACPSQPLGSSPLMGGDYVAGAGQHDKPTTVTGGPLKPHVNMPIAHAPSGRSTRASRARQNGA